MKVLVALVVMALAGCTTIVVPTPTGGSRADGTIELSYTQGAYQNAEIDWVKADAAAASRCAAWGYTEAERFGGKNSKCSNGNAYGCNRWIVTIPYQCVGPVELSAK